MRRRNARGVSSGTRIGASVRTVAASDPTGRSRLDVRDPPVRVGTMHPMRRRIMVSIFAVFVVAGAVAADLAVVDRGRRRRPGRGRRAPRPSPARPPQPTPTTTAAATTTTTQPARQRPAGDDRLRGRHPLRRRRCATSSPRIRRRCSRRSRPCSASADLTVANLETAVTERGTPAPKEFTFRAPAIGAHRARGRRASTSRAWRTTTAWTTDPVGLAGLARRDRDASGFPIIGIGNNATRGLRAVPQRRSRASASR